MITLANIRRAIYNIYKRLEILESNSGGSSGGSSGGGFSGDYNDLINKPTIPAAQIQSDWNQTNTSAKDYIKNKPTITNGQDGADGKSAYEVAVENGYSGTVQEWLASLHGQDGTNGTNGTNGVTPHIDSTSKHWMIGTTDTGVVAEGQDGTNPTGAVTSSTSGLKIEVVSSLPGSPDANTIYIVQ